MNRSHKIRLYPNKTQEDYINSLLGSYRFVGYLFQRYTDSTTNPKCCLTISMKKS